MHNIDVNIQNMILDQIDSYYSKFMERELGSYVKVLPTYLIEHLEKSISIEFMNKFPLFQKFDT